MASLSFWKWEISHTIKIDASITVIVWSRCTVFIPDDTNAILFWTNNQYFPVHWIKSTHITLKRNRYVENREHFHSTKLDNISTTFIFCFLFFFICFDLVHFLSNWDAIYLKKKEKKNKFESTIKISISNVVYIFRFLRFTVYFATDIIHFSLVPIFYTYQVNNIDVNVLAANFLNSCRTNEWMNDGISTRVKSMYSSSVVLDAVWVFLENQKHNNNIT